MTDKILEHIKNFYGVEPEYLWASTPNNAALRNRRSNKWFAALLGSLQKQKLGIKSEEKADVLNLKCDPIMSFAVIDNVRIFSGFHMNKEHRISVLLDGSVDLEELKSLVDMSYEIVDRRGKKQLK